MATLAGCRSLAAMLSGWRGMSWDTIPSPTSHSKTTQPQPNTLESCIAVFTSEQQRTSREINVLPWVLGWWCETIWHQRLNDEAEICSSFCARRSHSSQELSTILIPGRGLHPKRTPSYDTYTTFRAVNILFTNTATSCAQYKSSSGVALWRRLSKRRHPHDECFCQSGKHWPSLLQGPRFLERHTNNKGAC